VSRGKNRRIFQVDERTGCLRLALGLRFSTYLRVHRDKERIKYNALANDELKEMLYEIALENKIYFFEETGDVDFEYEIPGLARDHANYFQ